MVYKEHECEYTLRGNMKCTLDAYFYILIGDCIILVLKCMSRGMWWGVETRNVKSDMQLSGKYKSKAHTVPIFSILLMQLTVCYEYL